VGDRKRRNLSMGTVMIRCPETQRAISTGMQVDRATFHSTPVFFGRTLCPLCGNKHEWFAKDAWVCESGTAVCDPNCARHVA
jgi:hypothetical protein